MYLPTNGSSLPRRKAVSEKEVADLLDTIHSLSAEDGIKLSPVDFSVLQSATIDLPPITWVNYHKQGQNIKVTNSGFTAIVSGKWDNDRPYVCSGPLKDNYLFSQVHFHWGEHDDTGSEHSVNGIRYPLEMHVVHFKREYKTQEVALSKGDGIAIMVHLFAVQENRNPNLDQLTAVMQFIQSAHSSARLGQVPLAELVRPFDLNYFLYWGGVSSALGLHRILWLVSRKVLPVSSSQLAEFRMMCSLTGKPLKKNSSDPYPLQDRTLFLVSPSSHLDATVYGVSREPTRTDVRSETSSVLQIHDAEYKSLTGIRNLVPSEKPRYVVEDYEEKNSIGTRVDATQERSIRPDFMMDGIRIKNDVVINFDYKGRPTPCAKRVCMGKVDRKYVGKVTPTSESVEQSCVFLDKNNTHRVEPVGEIKYEKYERKHAVKKQSIVGYTNKVRTSQSSFNIRDSRSKGKNKKDSHVITTQSDVDIKRKLVHENDSSVEEACVTFDIAPTPLSNEYMYYPNSGYLSPKPERTRLVPLGDTTESSEVDLENDAKFVKIVTTRTQLQSSRTAKSVTETIEKTYAKRGKMVGCESRPERTQDFEDVTCDETEDRKRVDEVNEHRMERKLEETVRETVEQTYSKIRKETTVGSESQNKRTLEMKRVIEDDECDETRYGRGSRKEEVIEITSEETDKEPMEKTYSKNENSGKGIDRESQTNKIQELPKQVRVDDTSVEMGSDALKPTVRRDKEYVEMENDEASTIVTTIKIRKTHFDRKEEKEHTIATQYNKTNVREKERKLYMKREETQDEITQVVQLDTGQANDTKVYETPETTIKKITQQPHMYIKVVQQKPPDVRYVINEPLKRKKITAYYKTPIIRKKTDQRHHVCYRIYERLTTPKLTEILKVPVSKGSRYQNRHTVKKSVPSKPPSDRNDGIRTTQTVIIKTEKREESIYDEYITVNGKVYRRVGQQTPPRGQEVPDEIVPDARPAVSEVSLDNPIRITLKQKSKDVVPKPAVESSGVEQDNGAKYYITSIKPKTSDMEEKFIDRKAQYVARIPSENESELVQSDGTSTSETTYDSHEMFPELTSTRSETVLMKSDSEETLRVEVLKSTTEYGAEGDDKQGIEENVEELRGVVDNSQEDTKKMVEDIILPLIVTEDLHWYGLSKSRESFEKNEPNKQIHTVNEIVSGSTPDRKGAVVIETTTREESEPEREAVYQNVSYSLRSSQHQTKRGRIGFREVVDAAKVVKGKIKRFNEVKSNGRTLKPPEEKRSEYPVRSRPLAVAKGAEDVTITVKPSNNLKSNRDTGSSQEPFKDTQIRIKYDSAEGVKTKGSYTVEDETDTEEITIKEERKETVFVKKQVCRSVENSEYKSEVDQTDDRVEHEIVNKINDEEEIMGDENNTDSSKSLGDNISEVLFVDKMKKEEGTNIEEDEEQIRPIVHTSLYVTTKEQDVHEDRDSLTKAEPDPVVRTGNVEETVTISESIYEENVSRRTERRTERHSVRTESEKHSNTRYADTEEGKSNLTESKPMELAIPKYEIYYGEVKALENKTTGRLVKPEIIVLDENGMKVDDSVPVIVKEELKEPVIFTLNKIPKDRLMFLEALPVDSPGSTRIVKNRLKPHKYYRVFRKIGVTNSHFYFGNANPPSIPYVSNTEPSRKVDDSSENNQNSETRYVEDVTIKDKTTYEYTKHKTVMKTTKNEHTIVNNCDKIIKNVPKVTLKMKEKLKNSDGSSESASVRSDESNKNKYSIKTETVKDDAGEDSVVIYIRQEKTPATHIQPTITIDYTKTKDMTVSDLDTQRLCIQEMDPTTSQILSRQCLIPKSGSKEPEEPKWEPPLAFRQQPLTVACSSTVAKPMFRSKTEVVWKNDGMRPELTSNESLDKPLPSGMIGAEPEPVSSTATKCCSEYYPDTDPLSKTFPSTFSITWPKEQAEAYSGYQSPIRMYPSKLSIREFPKLQFCGHWTCRGQALLENTGSTIRLTLNMKTSVTIPYLKGGPLFDSYMFEELRFRWGKTDCCGAEHVFDSESRCLEAQFYHYKKTYGNITNALNYPDGVACVSVTFQTGGHLDDDFDDVIDGVKRVFAPDTSVKFPASAIFKWLRKHIETSQGYITYPGSLTVRPFTESVVWIVIVDPFVFCCQQSIQFRRVLGRNGQPLKNYRKSQPHNNRPIYYVPL